MLPNLIKLSVMSSQTVYARSCRIQLSEPSKQHRKMWPCFSLVIVFRDQTVGDQVVWLFRMEQNHWIMSIDHGFSSCSRSREQWWHASEPPPPPADPPRRLVTVVKERHNRSSFSQLDGEAGETEKEEDVIDFETWPADPPFNERYKVPPRKVRHPESVYGIGTFERIDQDTGHFLYEFENGYLVEV